MTDAQFHVFLTHLKAQLDEAVAVTEAGLPEDLRVTPEPSALVKKLIPSDLLRAPEPYYEALLPLYNLQGALARDIEQLEKAMRVELLDQPARR